MSFKISKKETDNKTVRFPTDLVARIESAIVGEETENQHCCFGSYDIYWRYTGDIEYFSNASCRMGHN